MMPPKTSTGGGGSGAKRSYLIAYNAISATLWFGVLARTAAVLLREGRGAWESGETYGELEWYTRVVQTGAVAEVGHSLVGELRFVSCVVR